jgi:hypothetical protein
MTVRQLAMHLGVHIGTVRRWVRFGCPCIELGSVGRGHGTQLDPVEVQQWRVSQLIPTLAAQAEADVLKILATALYDVLKRDGLMGQTLPAELMVLQVYERAHLNITHEPLQLKDLPEEMKRISAIHLDSVERGRHQRR